VRRYASALLAPLTIVLAVVAWEVAVNAFRIPRFILPAPTSIIGRFFEILPIILEHAQVTVVAAALGYAAGALAGLALAILMTIVPVVRSAIYPLVIASQTTPKIAIAPLLIIWFGVGLLPKVVIVALLAFFPILINAVAGLESVDRSQLDLMRSVNANQWQIYRHIRIPTAVPFIFAGLKLALTVSIIGAIVGEWVASEKGLGFLLVSYNAALRTTELFGVLLALVLLASLSFLLVAAAERLFSWQSRIALTQGATVAKEASL
jgi:ABC-type nitrate/sulfonate/bicarbonate transport system permease component